MRRSILAAVAANGVIGRAGTLPWHLPADLKRFRALTLGRTLIMGRRTYESIGRPLPGRETIVLTRRPDYAVPDSVRIARSLEDALSVASGDEVFIVGGAEVFAEALPAADRLYITEVHAAVEGETCFPVFDRTWWREIARERHAAGAHAEHAFSFVVYDRAG